MSIWRFSFVIFLVPLTYFAGGCSSGIATHRAFSDLKWESAASCDPVDISETIISKRKDPIFDFGRVQYRRSGAASGPIYEFSEGASFEYEGKRYSVRLLRIIAPSEHRVLGMPFLMELQFFAVSDDSAALALSIFVRKGKARPALRSMIENGSGELTMSDLKPSYRGHYYYTGALSVPPCYSVPYIVMKSAIEASPEDIDEYLIRWPYAERNTGKSDRIEETE